MAKDKSKKQAREERKLRRLIKDSQTSPVDLYQAEYDKIVIGLNKPERAGIKWTNVYSKDDLKVLRLFRDRYRRKKQNPPDLICKMPPYYFDFFQSNDFDGYADVARNQKQGFVYSLSTGLLERSHQYMFCAFSSPNFLTDMDSRGEIDDFNNNNVYFPRKIITGSTKPVSEPRRMMAVYLASIMVDFSAAHEYRHIQGGHVLYSRSHQASKLIDQALELECDLYAVLLILLEAASSFERLRERPGHSSSYSHKMLWIARSFAIPNLRTAYLFALTAVYAVFRILESSEKPSEDWEQDDHLPAQARLIECLIYAKELGLADFDEDTKALMSGVITLGEQFCLVNGIRDQMEFPAMDEKMQDHIKIIENIRSSLMPTLQKYAYVKVF